MSWPLLHHTSNDISSRLALVETESWTTENRVSKASVMSSLPCYASWVLTNKASIFPLIYFTQFRCDHRGGP